MKKWVLILLMLLLTLPGYALITIEKKPGTGTLSGHLDDINANDLELDGKIDDKVSDDEFTSDWSTVTDVAPSQAALYKYLTNFDADGDGLFSDEAWFPLIFDPAAPGEIGGTTPSTATFTELTVGLLTSTAVDGENRLTFIDNTTRSPAAGAEEIYSEGGLMKYSENGVEKNFVTIDDTAGDGDTTVTLSADKIAEYIAGVSVAAPTIQADDPTIGSATGWYLAQTSGDLFYVVHGVGVQTIAGTWAGDTDAPVLVASADSTHDGETAVNGAVELTEDNPASPAVTFTATGCTPTSGSCTGTYPDYVTPDLTPSGTDDVVVTFAATDLAGNAATGTDLVQEFAYDAGVGGIENIEVGTNGLTVTLTAAESVTVGSGGSGDLKLKVDGVPVTAFYTSGSGSTALVYTSDIPIGPSQVVTATYTQVGNGLELTSGGADIDTFTDTACTNSSSIASNIRYIDPGATGNGSGTSWTNAYASMSAAETALGASLSADWIFYCRGTTADTTAVTFDGFTSNSYNIIFVGDNDTGVWSDSHYRIEYAGASHAITCNRGGIRFSQIQFEVAPTANNRGVYHHAYAVAYEDNQFDSCIFVNTQATYYPKGIYSQSTLGHIVRNCTFNGFGTTYGAAIQIQGGTFTIHNNTFYGSTRGVYLVSGTLSNLRNNLFSSVATPTEGVTGSSSTDYNSTTTSSLGYTAQSHDRVSQTVTFVNAGTGDFHLGAADAGARDYGVSLSASFTGDITGHVRTGTWDIGAFEYWSGQ